MNVIISTFFRAYSNSLMSRGLKKEKTSSVISSNFSNLGARSLIKQVTAIFYRMQKLHFYFFCFYNSLYKDGFYLETYLNTTGRGKILPERRTILGLFFSTWLWTIAIRLITIDLLKHNLKILFYSFLTEMIIAAIIYAAYFYYFVDNNRFADIYAEYKSTPKFVQRQGARKVYWFLGLPLLLIPIILWWTTDRLHIDLTK